MKKELHYKYKYKENTRFKIIEGSMELDLRRVEQNLKNAQYGLDSMVMADMVPYMPMDTGQFIDVTRAMSQAIAGSGTVVAAAPPFGRYLYEGKVMVDSVTGKGPMKIPDGPGAYVLRFRKGAKLRATDRPLQYSKSAHPDAQDHWFDAAKKQNLSKWVKNTKKMAGGG